MSKEKKSHTSTRRDFLKTAGKFAVYTPPVIALMTKPGNTVFAKSVSAACTVQGVAFGNPHCDGEKPHPIFGSQNISVMAKNKNK